MKRKLGLSAFMLMILASSHLLLAQNNPFKTLNDSVSYSFGANVVKEGLEVYLIEMGIITDTVAVVHDYNNLFVDVTSDSERAKLEKELRFKIDSVNAANKINMEKFRQGLSETLPAKGKNAAYIMGLSLGDQIYKMSEDFKKENFIDEDSNEFDYDLFMRGVNDELDKKDLLIEDVSEVVGKKIKESKRKAYASQLEEEAKFLEENKMKEGVVTTPSGLQYRVLVEGKGPIPTIDDVVIAHYKGRLLGGTQFDSSYKRGEPAVLRVDRVIDGWKEALQIMPVGSKWELYIPSDLAYGAEGSREVIPPYATLVFQIELMDIMDEEK